MNRLITVLRSLIASAALGALCLGVFGLGYCFSTGLDRSDLWIKLIFAALAAVVATGGLWAIWKAEPVSGDSTKPPDRLDNNDAT